MSSLRKQRRELMERTKKQAAIINHPASRAVSMRSEKPKASHEGSARELIYYSSNGMVGTGLWCVSTDRPVAKPHTMETSPSSLTAEVDLKVNSELVSMLEKKCSKLVVNCERLRVERDQLKIELRKTASTIDNLSAELQEAKGKVGKVIQIKEGLENEIDEQCITHNLAQTQLEALAKEIEAEKRRAESYKQLYEREAEAREDEANEYEQELEAIRLEMQRQTQCSTELITELERQISLLQQTVDDRTSIRGSPNGGRDDKARAKLAKINVLIGENKALGLKVKEMEENRKQTHEFLRKREEDIRDLKSQLEQALKRVKLAQELKKHQADLVEQKDSHLKAVQDRLHYIESEYQSLVAALASQAEEAKRSPKKDKGLQEIVAVAARPELFQ